MRPRIVRVRLQTMSHALAQDDADRVVVRNQIVLDDAPAAQALAGSPGIHRSRTWLRRVVEEASIQVAGFRADVLQVERRPLPELALDVGAPLVLVRIR